MPAQRGFTLVEVIVALAILSLVMLSTVSALRTLGNTRSSLERHTARIDDIRSVSEFLRNSFATATPDALASGGLTAGGGGLGGISSQGWFEGGANWVEWKAPMVFGESYGGTFLIRLEMSGSDLMLRWQSLGGGGGVNWSTAPSRLVVAGVQRFQLAYREQHRGQWLSEWSRSSGTPALVRLQIQAADRYWPELIMGVNQ